MKFAPDPIDAWADRIEGAIARTPGSVVDRVMVVAETGSTQDAAAHAAGGRAGLMVAAGRQTGGRGQHGRVWQDTLDAGVAATFAVRDDGRDSGELAAAAGLAVLDAIDACSVGVAMRLKRPNDVLARCPDGVTRKLAGVLIERRSGLVLIGTGINVAQTSWADGLGAQAVSLAQLGVMVDRVSVLEALVPALTTALALGADQIDERWRALTADA